MGRYVVLEDVGVADCALDIEGADLADLFETAARALAELMVDPATLPTTVERTLVLSAPRLDLLLYDFLSELIYRKDRDQEVFTAARVRVSGAGPVQLTAEVRGGVIDYERTALRADPKGGTFHRFAVTETDGAWRAQVVI